MLPTFKLRFYPAGWSRDMADINKTGNVRFLLTDRRTENITKLIIGFRNTAKAPQQT
jgi:hypothetical protein